MPLLEPSFADDSLSPVNAAFCLLAVWRGVVAMASSSAPKGPPSGRSGDSGTAAAAAPAPVSKRRTSWELADAHLYLHWLIALRKEREGGGRESGSVFAGWVLCALVPLDILRVSGSCCRDIPRVPCYCLRASGTLLGVTDENVIGMSR